MCCQGSGHTPPLTLLLSTFTFTVISLRKSFPNCNKMGQVLCNAPFLAYFPTFQVSCPMPYELCVKKHVPVFNSTCPIYPHLTNNTTYTVNINILTHNVNRPKLSCKISDQWMATTLQCVYNAHTITQHVYCS